MPLTFPDSVQVARCTATAADHTRIYGSNQTVRAHIRDKIEKITDANGNEIVTSGKLYLPKETVIEINDKVTLDNGSVCYVAAKKRVRDDRIRKVVYLIAYLTNGVG